MGEAADKLGQQARKVKGKFEGRKRGVKAAVEFEVAEAVEAPVKKAPKVKMPRILKARRQTIKTLTITEAASKLDGTDGVVVFLDANTARIAVLYRAGGELTLVETTA